MVYIQQDRENFRSISIGLHPVDPVELQVVVRERRALDRGAVDPNAGVAGDRLVVTLDIAGVTEIRTFDAKTLKPAGKLKFVSEP